MLQSLSFEVEPGEAVGIVGPSGSGKSTLVQLLLRLRHPVDGPVRRRESRSRIALRLLVPAHRVRAPGAGCSGTIGDNIRFPRPELDQEAVERAAKLAYLHDDVMSLVRGLRHRGGERGGAVSGGQRQRIVLARALAEEPDVLILDEPTSALT